PRRTGRTRRAKLGRTHPRARFCLTARTFAPITPIRAKVRLMPEGVSAARLMLAGHAGGCYAGKRECGRSLFSLCTGEANRRPIARRALARVHGLGASSY